MLVGGPFLRPGSFGDAMTSYTVLRQITRGASSGQVTVYLPASMSAPNLGGQGGGPWAAAHLVTAYAPPAAIDTSGTIMLDEVADASSIAEMLRAGAIA